MGPWEDIFRHIPNGSPYILGSYLISCTAVKARKDMVEKYSDACRKMTSTVILVYVITLTISSEVSAYAKTDTQPSLQRCVSLDSYVDGKIPTHRTSNSACLRRMSEG